MILRRFMQHINEQNWFAVGLDVLVVIVGIFLGMQVTEWNEKRRDNSDAERFLVRLQADLETEIFGWERALDYYSVAHKYGLNALRIYNEEKPSNPKDFLVSLYQASQLWGITSQRATYDELISSGKIYLIKSEVTRDRLSNHYLRMESLKSNLSPERGEYQYRRLVRSYMHEDVQGAIRRECGDKYTVNDRNYYFIAIPSICEPAIEFQLAETTAKTLFDNHEVRGELRFRVSVLESHIAALKNAIQVANTTLAQVKIALNEY